MQVVVLNWKNYLGMGEAYVQRMYRMVSEHLTIPHEFKVVTEDILPPGRVGWFNKLYLFQMFEGEVLYLDLDLDITANIDHLIEQGRTDPSRIWARNDFSYPLGHPPSGKEQTINSSVMYWQGRKDMTGSEALIPVTHGDQGIITRLFWPDGIGLFPETSIRSYKYQVLRGMGRAPIVVYHGHPKPHQVERWA